MFYVLNEYTENLFVPYRIPGLMEMYRIGK